jgi:hypothetical protein
VGSGGPRFHSHDHVALSFRNAARSFTAIWNRYASSNAALSRSGRSLRATVSQASRSAA